MKNNNRKVILYTVTTLSLLANIFFVILVINNYINHNNEKTEISRDYDHFYQNLLQTDQITYHSILQNGVSLEMLYSADLTLGEAQKDLIGMSYYFKDEDINISNVNSIVNSLVSSNRILMNDLISGKKVERSNVKELESVLKTLLDHIPSKYNESSIKKLRDITISY